MLEVFDDTGAQTRGRPLDVAIAALAGRQHGAVSARQLEALGLGPGAIRHRVTVGRLHRVFRGVFAVGYPRLTARGRWMAAVLAGGEDALLSHRSAASLWGLAIYTGSSVDVTVPASRRSSRPGLALHGGLVHPEDGTSRDGIPVTSVARTLFDLGEVVDSTRLAWAVEESERAELFDLRAVERLCRRSRGRRGLKGMRLVLGSIGPIAETRSELERRFVALCGDSDLPLPGINRIVAGFEVDAVWEPARLVVELDGYAFHKTRPAFERDRARDAELLLCGYQVLRVTAGRLRDDPDSIIDTIRTLLVDKR